MTNFRPLKMRKLAVVVGEVKRFGVYLGAKASRFIQICQQTISLVCYFLLFQVSPFWIQLGYYVTVSAVGYFALKVSAQNKSQALRIKDFDVFFTSVSATTASSMSTVEMEDFSSAQLTVMTILMLLSGEIFTSLLELQLGRYKFLEQSSLEIKPDNSTNHLERIESGEEAENKWESNVGKIQDWSCSQTARAESESDSCLKFLGYVVLVYLLTAHVMGSTIVSLYLALVPGARTVVESKGIGPHLFSVFVTVSTFANCGFIPTNENMIAFRKHPGLLLILIPQILIGNTLYPPCLRFIIWVLQRLTGRHNDSWHSLLEKNHKEMGHHYDYFHLVSGIRASYMAMTAIGFITIQLTLFCSMQWNSPIMDGLSPYQRFVNSLFQIVNSRHAGESVFDLSTVFPAVLVLFALMMYLPPYTTFLPPKYQEKSLGKNGGRRVPSQIRSLTECVLLSQLSFLVISIICICISERDRMMDDPLNFNVANIAFEVFSAYGNVGFSTGYSCSRRIKTEGYCGDAWYGFSGRFSTMGKFIIVVVMFIGKLNKFNKKGGKAWLLLPRSNRR